MLGGEIGVGRRDGLKLDERPKLLDLIEMDPHIPPEQQTTAFDDDSAYADRSGERRAQRLAVVDLDDPVSALALLGLVGAVELDQMRSAGLLFAELESASRNREVGIALRYGAAILGRCRAGSMCACDRSSKSALLRWTRWGGSVEAGSS